MKENNGMRRWNSNKRKRDAIDYLETADRLSLSDTSSNMSLEYLRENCSPRPYTVTVAIPVSIISQIQTRELKTFFVGQIARCLAIHKVDEIVIYADGVVDESPLELDANPCLFLARLLQYVETPSYLRKSLFPMHADFRFAGLLSPMDAPHHMKRDDISLYREGVVSEKTSSEGSLVNVGLRSEVVIDRFLKPGVRTTVQLDQPTRSGGSSSSRGHGQAIRGTPVSPNTPRETYGIYWGYQTRVAKSLGEVFSSCPYFDNDGGYDLFVGHSEKNGSSALAEAEGDPSDPSFTPFSLPSFRHMLVVFGGNGGIEAAVDADERLNTAGRDADTLFDLYLRIQGDQGPMAGSRTLRGEEALSLMLTKLSPYVNRNTAPPSTVG